MRLFEAKKVGSREFPLTPQVQSTAVLVFEETSLGFCLAWMFFGREGAFYCLGFFFLVDHFISALCPNEWPRPAL